MGHGNGASLQWSRVPGFAPSSTPSRLAPLGVQCVEASLYCTSVTQTQPGGRIEVVQVVKVSPAAVPDVQISVRIHAGVATIRLKTPDVAFLR